MDFYNGRVLIVDLSSKEVQDVELPEEKVKELVGGPSLNSYLIGEHGEDSLVIGTGILTCSFFPSSAMGVVSWKDGEEIKHLPLNWLFPQEFKLTGFDFLVIKGSSDKTVHLWIRDEICDVLEGDEIGRLNVWEVVDKLKEDHGDENLHVLVAGENALSQDYWGGFDSSGCNEIFRRKNLKAVAVRGMGSLYFEESLFEKFVEVVKKAKSNLPSNLWENTLSGKEDFKKLLHRPVSCFNCGLNCNPFVMHKGNPEEMKESEIDEPGFLLLNPSYIEGDDPENTELNLKRGSLSVKGGGKIPQTYFDFLKLHSVEVNEEKILKYLSLGLCPIFMEIVLKGDTSSVKEILGETVQGL